MIITLKASSEAYSDLDLSCVVVKVEIPGAEALDDWDLKKVDGLFSDIDLEWQGVRAILAAGILERERIKKEKPVETQRG